MIKHKKQEFFEHKNLNSYEKKPREFDQTIKLLKKDCHEPKVIIDEYPTPAKFNSFFVKVGHKLQTNTNLIPAEAVANVTTI